MGRDDGEGSKGWGPLKQCFFLNLVIVCSGDHATVNAYGQHGKIHTEHKIRGYVTDVKLNETLEQDD